MNKLDILGKSGTLKILGSAQDSMRSSRKTPEELGLSKRVYYSRLRDLQDFNAIVKSGESYELTEVGSSLLFHATRIILA